MKGLGARVRVCVCMGVCVCVYLRGRVWEVTRSGGWVDGWVSGWVGVGRNTAYVRKHAEK